MDGLCLIFYEWTFIHFMPIYVLGAAGVKRKMRRIFLWLSRNAVCQSWQANKRKGNLPPFLIDFSIFGVVDKNQSLKGNTPKKILI